MRRKLLFALPMCMFLLTLNGCGMFGKGGMLGGAEKGQKLASAVNLIKSGQKSEAGRFLEQVIDGGPENGVTDESLFRLALLKINDGEQGEAKSSIALLDRLRSSYPASVWTSQSAALYSYLMVVKTIRNREREYKTLREKNLSLSRDVSGLRQTIEQLKALDRELELKIRR